MSGTVTWYVREWDERHELTYRFEHWKHQGEPDRLVIKFNARPEDDKPQEEK